MTTASEATAIQAHEVGSPLCRGQIGLIVDFTRTPMAGPPRRARSRESDPGARARPSPAESSPPV